LITLFSEPLNSNLAVQRLGYGNNGDTENKSPHKFGLAVDIPFRWAISQDSPAGEDFFDSVIKLLENKDNLSKLVKYIKTNLPTFIIILKSHVKDEYLRSILNNINLIIYSSHIHMDIINRDDKSRILVGALNV